MATVEPLSPEWWLTRLYSQLVVRQDEVAFYDAYYRGDFPLPWLAPQAQEDFRRILRMTRSNYMGLVVDATAERLQVEGFRPDPDSPPDRETWRIWQANHMDSDSDQGLLEALIGGVSYLLVEPNYDDLSTPSIFVEHASQAIVEHFPGTGRRVAAAGLKVWNDDWTGQIHATLYTPGWVWKFAAARRGDGVSPQWKPRAVPGEDFPAVNVLGVVPLEELPNNPRLLTGGVSELADVTDIQDRINKTIADRLLTQDYGAFPQKWATGWPESDDKGNPTPIIKVGRDRMVTTEVAETKFGQFTTAALDPYSSAKREDVKDIASRTRTPAQYLLGEMSNVNGEALALDTPIPTPRGLVAIGGLLDGDEVYDERGVVQRVECAHPVMQDRPCFRVTFDDDTSFVADAGHRWAVSSIPARARGTKTRTQRTERAVLTTETIAGALRTASGHYVHAVDMAGPPDGAESRVSVDPYVLGAYLGDGCTYNGSIAVGDGDLHATLALLAAAGESATWRRTRTVNLVTCHRSETQSALRGRLNALGVLYVKRIPEAYLAGSFKQRLALLQGLMDTDGTASRRHSGAVALELHDEHLARDAHRLVCSLGHKAALRASTYVKDGVKRVRWRMQWYPRDVVFRLERKAALQVDRAGMRPKAVRRVIVSVEPMESVPVRCLTVTGPSHLFLAGVGHVPTHNTLKASESGLVSKVRSRQRPYGEHIEAAVRLLRRAARLPDDGPQMEVVWRNPEYRTPGEVTDAAIKRVQAGLATIRQAREDVGYSVTQIERMEQEDAQAADPVLAGVTRALRTAGDVPIGG